MTEIKPCPFCGEHEYGFTITISNMPVIRGKEFYRVTCTNCGSMSEDECCKELAIDSWNRRTIEDILQDRINTMQQVLDEKSMSIDNLIKEHVGMREEIDTAREALLKIRGHHYPNGVPLSMTADEALNKMDEIRKGYING